MEKLLNPELIKAAASSTLGILSLMCVTIAFLALAFFRESPIWAKLTVFVLLFAGVAGFGYTTTTQKDEKSPAVKLTPPTSNNYEQTTEKLISKPPETTSETLSVRIPNKQKSKNERISHSIPPQPKDDARNNEKPIPNSSGHGQIPTYNSQGMKGPDASGSISPTLNVDCPEITVMDMSKFPPESRIERRCVQ